MRTRWIVLLALVAVLVALLPSAVLAANGRLAYTALGDSIAYGIGATRFADRIHPYGYVYHFRDKLAKPDGVDVRNKAVPGFDTGDLLRQLARDPFTRNAVRTADVLTISIGGNNLLPCARKNYTVLDQDCGDAGVTDFKRDWPLILQQIRSGIGSKATLYVMTLYNPYKGDDRNYAIAERFIDQINTEIRTSATTYGYVVADVHKHFEGRFPDGSWKVCAWTRFCAPFRDPHPTDRGHQEIANQHADVYR